MTLIHWIANAVAWMVAAPYLVLVVLGRVVSIATKRAVAVSKSLDDQLARL